jgi:tRNA (guanine-N7-)-methyltransferase
MEVTDEAEEDTTPEIEPELIDQARRVEFAPADYFQRAQMSDLFAREAPFDLDIGCGEGAFLLEMARRFPERDFLGIERLLGRVRKVCRNVARQDLANVRVLRLEIAYALRYLLPLESVSIAHVGFPDPWPKRHHQSRRLVQDGFMEAMRGILVAGGELRIKTDDEPYFLWMEKVFTRAKGYERIDWPEDEEYPKTNFEQHFLSQGLPIYRARLRKV